MKKALALLLAVLLLAACGTGGPEAPVPAATSASPAATTAPAATAPNTTAPAATAPAATYPFLDYSHHEDPNEALYRTVLADPALLREGAPVYALEEPPAQWKQIFEGFSKDSIWGYDVRSMDISSADLTGLDWNYFSFNSGTVWPDALPEGFDPAAILEYGKNPGLGIRELHARGIDGAGVGIAILDQPLLLGHEEYAGNLLYYERIHCGGDTAAMHGPAVASIAVGKTVGVAPGSKLYYIAQTIGHVTGQSYEFDASILADGILRVLQINENLPQDEKIRVISISRGYSRRDKGYQALQDAIAKADAENIFVITTSPDAYYPSFILMGMERDYRADPDRFDAWLPAGWLSNFYANAEAYGAWLWVPMGSRTYAGSHADNAYEIGRRGGLSWAVPWMAGFYALCCQVKADITPAEFIQLCKDTSITSQIEKDGREYPLGMIVNPAAVIEALEP